MIHRNGQNVNSRIAYRLSLIAERLLPIAQCASVSIRVHPCPIQWHTDEHGLDGSARIRIRENPYHPRLSVSYSNGTQMNTDWTDRHG